MRFGVFLPQGFVMDLPAISPASQWDLVVQVARDAERLGYESVWVYDHFHTFPAPSREPVLEAFSLMAALAVSTTRIRLGQMCACNAYRPPSYLAKVTATIDVLSEGRLDVGIGAGWYEQEFAAYGYEFPGARTRIRQLAESAQVLKAMWTEPQASFEGAHYRLTGAINEPKPVQKPHPPLWIAGGGEQLTLRVVAEHGDWANFGRTPGEFKHKRRVLHAHCAAVGRDPARVHLSSNLGCFLAESSTEATRKQERVGDRLLAKAGGNPAISLDGGAFGNSLVGDPQSIVDRLSEWAALGCELVMLQFWDVGRDREPLELFAAEVMPHLADA